MTIEEIKQVLKEISPWPWLWVDGIIFSNGNEKGTKNIGNPNHHTDYEYEVNYSFIAKAPQIINYLIKELEDARLHANEFGAEAVRERAEKERLIIENNSLIKHKVD